MTPHTVGSKPSFLFRVVLCTRIALQTWKKSWRMWGR
jgi:hypothetical protein